MGVKCFLVHETDRFRASLRRYAEDSHDKCPGPMGYHNADGPEIGVFTATKSDDGYYSLDAMERDNAIPHDDSRWPAKCDGCDYQFTASDRWQVFHNHIFVDDAGKEYFLREAHKHPGMMWFADWRGEWDKGPDGHSLIVVCPDGSEWSIDGRCSNCTLPNNSGPYGQAHRCWTRTGIPPLVSVGKQFGKSCSAGGGSIVGHHGYHGFLGINGAQPGYFT